MEDEMATGPRSHLVPWDHDIARQGAALELEEHHAYGEDHQHAQEREAVHPRQRLHISPQRENLRGDRRQDPQEHDSVKR
jgi:hypothetical protein